MSIAGQILAEGILQTTDRHAIALTGSSAHTRVVDGYVELCGTKTAPAVLVVDYIQSWLGAELNCEIWDGAIVMRHHPDLMQFFDPDTN